MWCEQNDRLGLRALLSGREPSAPQRCRFAGDFPREFTHPIAIRCGCSQRAVEIAKMATQPITLLLHLRELVTKSGAVLLCKAIPPLVVGLVHGVDLFADAIAVATNRPHRAVAGSVALEIASAVVNALSTLVAGAYLWMPRCLGLWPALAAAWLTGSASAAATAALTGH